jgi:hypothetical protein
MAGRESDRQHNEQVQLDWAELAEQDEVEPELDADDGAITKPWDPSLIRVDSRPMSVNQVLDMIDQGDLELQPEFQRRRVWNEQQKCLLIESLLLRIPLPAFYFASDEHGHLQVIDGLQRLSTIHDFVRGGLEKNSFFHLNKLEYLGKTVGKKGFEDLKGTVWGRRILQASLVANVVDPQTPTPVKLNIFARLNKQGTPLSQQELRHAMSGPRSRKFLSELASTEEFDLATGGSVRNSHRMHDLEMVLRSCAFLLTPYSQYGDFDSLSDFLTKSTEMLDDAEKTPPHRLKELKDMFRKSMSNAHVIFGDLAFRKMTHLDDGREKKLPINKPLFEIWSVNLTRFDSKTAQRRKSDFIEANRTVLKDNVFLTTISLNTGSTRSVTTRFSKLEAALESAGIPNE